LPLIVAKQHTKEKLEMQWIAGRDPQDQENPMLYG
jgi:hypothetical protein